MQDLRERPMAMQNIADISTGSGTTQLKTVPHECELRAVAANFTVVTDAALTFDVLVNGADSGVDVLVPSGEGGADGDRYPLSAQLFLAAGDGIRLSSNNEQVAASEATFTAILMYN